MICQAHIKIPASARSAPRLVHSFWRAELNFGCSAVEPIGGRSDFIRPTISRFLFAGALTSQPIALPMVDNM
ncbi:MAG: hypothetical protein Q8P67_00365 [archaeon]|nr:hypothetical protein [archaeon]